MVVAIALSQPPAGAAVVENSVDEEEPQAPEQHPVAAPSPVVSQPPQDYTLVQQQQPSVPNRSAAVLSVDGCVRVTHLFPTDHQNLLALQLRTFNQCHSHLYLCTSLQ